MKIDEILSFGGNAFTYALSAIQTDDVLKIISFILSSVTSAVLIFFRLWSWWKSAKADDKITKEEIDEAIKIVEDHKEEKHK